MHKTKVSGRPQVHDSVVHLIGMQASLTTPGRVLSSCVPSCYSCGEQLVLRLLASSYLDCNYCEIVDFDASLVGCLVV
jgi:hypothetical protein